MQNQAVEINMEKKFTDIQQKLENSFKQTSQEFEMNRKLQEKKMADEIQNLTNLRDTFAQIKEGIERDNAPQTSKSFRNYVNLQGKMQQMGEELSQWSLDYKSAHLDETSPIEDLLKAFAISYQEETLGQKSEGGKSGRKRGGKKGPKPGKKEKAEKQGKKTDKQGKKGETTASSSPLKTSATNVKWEHFMVQKKPNMDCIAATKSDDLFITTNEKFSCFKTSPPKMLYEHDMQGENIDAIVMATSKADSVSFLVKLDTKKKSLKFLSSKGKSKPYDYVTKFHSCP